MDLKKIVELWDRDNVVSPSSTKIGFDERQYADAIQRVVDDMRALRDNDSKYFLELYSGDPDDTAAMFNSKLAGITPIFRKNLQKLISLLQSSRADSLVEDMSFEQGVRKDAGLKQLLPLLALATTAAVYTNKDLLTPPVTKDTVDDTALNAVRYQAMRPPDVDPVHVTDSAIDTLKDIAVAESRVTDLVKELNMLGISPSEVSDYTTGSYEMSQAGDRLSDVLHKIPFVGENVDTELNYIQNILKGE